MLNHTYTSVKNANLVDCGKKQHISSQPVTLLKDNYLGEFRTELDKKKVLANLGVVTELTLEWEYIKGDISRSSALMTELDNRTKYISKIDDLQKTIIEGVQYLETVVTTNKESLLESKILELENTINELDTNLENLKNYLENPIKSDISNLQASLDEISENINNITNLITVSTKSDNALELLSESDYPGLYVKDLTSEINTTSNNISILQQTVGNVLTNLEEIQSDLDKFVTKEELGGDNFNFVDESEFNSYISTNNEKISDIDENILNIKSELTSTLKSNQNGKINELSVSSIKGNDENIELSNSFKITSGIPLDIRFVVETLEDLYNISPIICYSGMGVIVNELSALYILRKPKENESINQEYISNLNNWKCPEDLVTIALSQEEYDSLSEINPNVFYYIYEKDISRTDEPIRENFESDEEFEIAFQEWKDSLKILSQEYMSAVWGTDIENKLNKKVDSDVITTLQTLLINLLNENINILTTDILNLTNRINSLEQQINDLNLS